MDHLKEKQRKINPREQNNFISNLFFLYTLPLYSRGFKKDLNESDLYEVVSSHSSKKLGDQIEREWEAQKLGNKHLSIKQLLVKCYAIPYLKLGLVQGFINVAEILIHPYALGKLIAYFKTDQTEYTIYDAYFYASIVIGFNFFQCVYKHNYWFALATFGLRMRVALTSFLYRKALKLSPAHLGEISIGKIVTLITKDVETFEVVVFFANDLWIAILKTIIVSCSLYNKIGTAALAGVAVFILSIPLQIYLGSLTTAMKMWMCKKTDERLQLTQETLSAIRIIKMYTWEKIFFNRITAIRNNEVHSTFKIYILRFLIITIGSLTSYIAFYVMMASYIYLGNNISAETLYFIIATFRNLTYGLSILFPIGVYYTAEVKSAIKRIGNVLKSMDVAEENSKNSLESTPKILLTHVTVEVHNKMILKDIDLEITNGLNLITGPVGSGKSFLLKTILQDYDPKEGKLISRGTISYASQEPWLFPSSIKQNILFGEKYDENRYNEVLKVCALIYDFELLEEGDSTIVEDRGINLSKGQQARINLARAVYKESDIYLLDDSLSALDAHVSQFIFQECIKKFLKNKIVLLVTHNQKCLYDANTVILMKDGRITFSGKPQELLLENIALFDNSNKEISNIVEHTEDDEDSAEEETKLITETTTEKKVYQEKQNLGEVDFDIYKTYIRFGGGFIVLALVYSIFILAQFTMSYTDRLVSEWVNLEEKISNSSISGNASAVELGEERTNLFYMYTFMTAGHALTSFGRAAALLLFARAASKRIHKAMISNIINASMKFFDTNFIGNILNRFSKDLTILDERVAEVLYNIMRMFLVIIGIVTLIGTVNAFSLIPMSVFFLILIILRRCCLRTSRNLKRLDALTKSPVIGHLNATLEGVTTIRAFKAQTILKNEFDRHQDLYTSASYTLQSSMRSFALTMDLLCGFLISLIILGFLIINDGTLAGFVGLAITQAFDLTSSLQWTMRQWAEIENQMTSVERVLEYTKIKEENKQGLHVDNWPKRGEVVYKNVCLSYTNSNEHVLKNISFAASPKEKIGIVGRTGAGKSSIISTLFRLYEVEGKILIDGVDTKTLSLDFLRENISIIPQDPVLFTGSIRENIDPIGQYTDNEIWKAIELANLKSLVPSLDLEIKEAGAHFSIGQRQLICMARAVIRNNIIIVLDEATANMDAETDELIHKTIEKNFSECTVFTIAHKLHSILKCDKVMVMDKGEIIEFDKPFELLQNHNGVFHNMVDKAGLLEQYKM